jgi:hypothetical protein
MDKKLLSWVRKKDENPKPEGSPDQIESQKTDNPKAKKDGK